MKKEKLINYNYKKILSFVKDRPGHDFRYALNSSYFKKKTKWNSRTNLLNGLKKTLYWYLDNNSWYKQTIKRYKGQRLGLK